MEKKNNSEKIRTIFNELQGNIPILSSLSKLKFKIPALSFNYYINHINYLIKICEKDLPYKFCWKMFRKLFEGKNEFLEYTEEKKKVIDYLISILKEEDQEKIQRDIILKLGTKSDSNLAYISYFKTIMDIMNALKFEQTLISIFLMYTSYNDLTKEFVIQEFFTLIKEKFPYSKIHVDNDLSDDTCVGTLLDGFEDITNEFDNYVDLNWDKEKKLFLVSKMTNDEILNDIQSISSISKQKSNKGKNNKKIINNIKIGKGDENNNEKINLKENEEINVIKEENEDNNGKEESEQELKQKICELRNQLLEKNQIIAEKDF